MSEQRISVFPSSSLVFFNHFTDINYLLDTQCAEFPILTSVLLHPLSETNFGERNIFLNIHSKKTTHMSKREQKLVSILQSMYDTHPEDSTLDAIYQYLILDTLRADTEKHRYYRSTGQKKQAQSIKDKMLNFTPSVLLADGKAEDNITDYTGFAMADFDHVPPDDLARCFALLNADPYVVLAYITVSGEGLRVIYCTDVTDLAYHADAFLQGNAHYAQLLGYDYDPQCRNIARTSILCHCPQAIYHPQAECMHIELAPQTKAKAEKNATRKPGRPRKVHTATIAEAAKVIVNLLEVQGKSYVEGRRNEYISCAFYLMNHYGVDQDEVLRWGIDSFADYDPAKLDSILRSVYRHTDDHGTQKLPTAKGDHIPFANLPEVEEFLATQAQVRNNVVTEKREIRFDDQADFRDITDRDENTLWSRANKKGVTTSPSTIQMVLNSEFVPDFHPFLSFVSELDPWDGTTDYIGRLADTVRTTDQPLFRDYFRKWFVGFVASLIEPRIINHVVLVLIGGQGTYKTTWMNRLLPAEWESYFRTKTTSNHATKDDRISLAQFALICFEEIDSMRSADMNQLKAMITMPAVDERSSYARNTAHRPHVASFCATGNNVSFLNDPTGTRRWLAFEVLSIDDPYQTVLPYRHIYAQALALFRSGFPYWFNQEEMERLSVNNERFEVPCMERELVLMYYRLPVAGEHGVFVSTAEVMQRINALIKNPLSINALGSAMRKIGFASCRSNSVRGYRVMELTQEEISARKHKFDEPTNRALDF